MTPMTYAEVLDGTGIETDVARKTGLVLRAAGRPLTHEGYMFEPDIAALIFYSEPLPPAYDAAERALRMEEQARDENPMDQFALPQDSHITPSVIARRAARDVDWSALNAVPA